MRSRIRTPLALLASAALLLTACGGGDEEPAPADEAPESTEESDEDVDAAADKEEPADDADADDAADDDAAEEAADDDDGGAAEDDAAASSDDEADDDGAGLLEDLSFDREPLRVDYEVDFEMPDSPDRMTIAQDGERVATWVTVQGIQSATFVDADEQVAMCFDDGSGWMCLNQDLGEQAPMDGVGDEMFDDLASGKIDPREVLQDPYPATIAGRDAICGTSAEVGQDGELCFDTASGMLLRLQMADSGSGRISMEAIEVTEATEEDLTPPADPQSFG